MMASELEHQSVLQLSKCHMKSKVEFWGVQLIMCYYFIIFNRRVLLLFLLRTYVDFERMINGRVLHSHVSSGRGGVVHGRG